VAQFFASQSNALTISDSVIMTVPNFVEIPYAKNYCNWFDVDKVIRKQKTDIFEMVWVVCGHVRLVVDVALAAVPCLCLTSSRVVSNISLYVDSL